MEEDCTKMGKDYCPTCNYQCDTASAVDGDSVPPMPHDLSVCLNCGEWLEYSDDMTLILMPLETKKDLSRENLNLLLKSTAYIKQRGFIRPIEK